MRRRKTRNNHVKATQSYICPSPSHHRIRGRDYLVLSFVQGRRCQLVRSSSSTVTYRPHPPTPILHFIHIHIRASPVELEGTARAGLCRPHSSDYKRPFRFWPSSAPSDDIRSESSLLAFQEPASSSASLRWPCMHESTLIKSDYLRRRIQNTGLTRPSGTIGLYTSQRTQLGQMRSKLWVALMCSLKVVPHHHKYAGMSTGMPTRISLQGSVIGGHKYVAVLSGTCTIFAPQFIDATRILEQHDPSILQASNPASSCN